MSAACYSGRGDGREGGGLENRGQFEMRENERRGRLVCTTLVIVVRM